MAAPWRRGVAIDVNDNDRNGATGANGADRAARSPLLPPRDTRAQQLAMDAIDAVGDDLENDVDPAGRVYRPLLFQSTGYASSELYRDTYEMRTRMLEQPPASTSPSAALLPRASGNMNAAHKRPSTSRYASEPHIRLETLSSRAATTVLWITYVAFALAIALPYVQPPNFLRSVVTLAGGVCTDDDRMGDNDTSCIAIDTHRNVAEWSGVVFTVSHVAGAIELSVQIADVRNASAFERLDALWRSDAPVDDMSFALAFNVSLYGVDTTTTPMTQHLLAHETNQSVWVECKASKCARAVLLDASQDALLLQQNNDISSSSSAFNAVVPVVTFPLRTYPNRFGDTVTYDVAYTKPLVHSSELVLRVLLLVLTLVVVPLWGVTIYKSHTTASTNVLAIQKTVGALGIVLFMYQNPLDVVTSVLLAPTSVSLQLRCAIAMCHAAAEASFVICWLFLLDAAAVSITNTRSLVLKLLFGVAMVATDATKTVFQSRALATALLPLSSLHHKDVVLALCGLVRLVFVLLWVVWLACVAYRTAAHLRPLPYMSTRGAQLSFRFLFLEALLLVAFVVVQSLVQLVDVTETWYTLGWTACIQRAVHVFGASSSSLQAGERPALGKLLFVSVSVFLVLFVHLPPATRDSTGRRVLGTTAFDVHEAPRVDRFGFLLPDAQRFCVETAKWVLEVAYQAYFDPPGRPSASGYGELNVAPLGFELVTHLRSSGTDTHVIVAMDGVQQRLVIAFRGTTSRANWKSNMRFHQKVLWVQRRRVGHQQQQRQTCIDRTKDALSKVPLLNMTLPRVHSGFWKAYASVRDELKEVTRLLLDENPGVSVFVTGHSMGGALAVLAAYDLAVTFSMRVNMYNFGGPRVGNPSFCRYYNKCVPASYRVVMDGDIVPGVPRFWGLYQHVGTEVAIDLEGNLIVDPSFIERHLHVSSKTKTATHATSVYRTSVAKCLENLTIC